MTPLLNAMLMMDIAMRDRMAEGMKELAGGVAAECRPDRQHKNAKSAQTH